MSNKSTLIIDDKVGVCVKGTDKVVAVQNDSCRRICGNMVGKTCSKGCMRLLEEMPPGSLKENSFVPLKNIFPDEGIVNALMLNNNGFVTTLLFDVSRTVDEQLLTFEPYGLTYTEGLIVRMVLEGYTNAEIAKKFCVARSTLKSHLNHIYRKIPIELRKEIMGKRGGATKIVEAPAPKKQDEAS